MKFCAPARFAPALWLVLALLVVPLSLAGCAKDEDYVPDEPADLLYNEGLSLLNNKQDYKDAAKKFDEVDRAASLFRMGAQGAADVGLCLLPGGKITTTASTPAKRYMTLHPGSPDAAYAQYLIGASYFDQILDVSRDQARADKAIDALQEVVRKYPEHANTPIQRQEEDRDGARSACRQGNGSRPLLSWTSRDFTGAINRFKVVVTQYQTTRHVEEALERLTEAYMCARHHRRGADRRRRARAQFPGQPLVQGRL